MHDMDKDMVVAIVRDEIKKFIKDELDKEVKKILHRSGSQTRTEMTTVIKDAMESVYKLLWQKRDFWKNDIR